MFLSPARAAGSRRFASTRSVQLMAGRKAASLYLLLRRRNAAPGLSTNHSHYKYNADAYLSTYAIREMSSLQLCGSTRLPPRGRAPPASHPHPAGTLDRKSVV